MLHLTSELRQGSDSTPLGVHYGHEKLPPAEAASLQSATTAPHLMVMPDFDAVQLATHGPADLFRRKQLGISPSFELQCSNPIKCMLWLHLDGNSLIREASCGGLCYILLGALTARPLPCNLSSWRLPRCFSGCLGPTAALLLAIQDGLLSFPCTAHQLAQIEALPAQSFRKSKANWLEAGPIFTTQANFWRQGFLPTN